MGKWISIKRGIAINADKVEKIWVDVCDSTVNFSIAGEIDNSYYRSFDSLRDAMDFYISLINDLGGV